MTPFEDNTDQLIDKLFSDEVVNETIGSGVAAVNTLKVKLNTYRLQESLI